MKLFLRYFFYRLRRLREVYSAPSLTVQYPFVKRRSHLFSRNSLRLEAKECTGCLKCESVCPAAAISIETKDFVDELVLPVSSNGYIFERKVVQMRVDYGKCIFCVMCVDECRPQALLVNRELPPVAGQSRELVDNLIKTKELPKIAWRKDR